MKIMTWKRRQRNHRNSAGMIAAILLTVFSAALFSALSPVIKTSAAKTNAEGKAAAEAELTLDKGKEYHAYMLFQAQNSWVFRGKFWEADKGPKSENWNRLLTSLNVTTPITVDGTVEDAVIKGNGRYTVRLSGLNGSPSAGVDNAEFGILGFSTDIPKNDIIKFDNIKIKIDGAEKGTVTGNDVYYDKDDIDDPGLITVEVFNAWHEECVNLPLTLPNDSLEISFDVSGFQYDNPDAKNTTDNKKLDQDTADGSKLDRDAADKDGQKDSAGQDDNRTTTDDKKSNKALPITIAVIIIIILIGGGIYLILKKDKN